MVKRFVQIQYLAVVLCGETQMLKFVSAAHIFNL